MTSEKEKSEKELIASMIKFIYDYIIQNEGDLRNSTLDKIYDNTNYVEVLYLGINESDMHQEIIDDEENSLINFKEAFITICSSIENHILE